MSITELNDRRKLIKETKVVLPNEIDPNAPKPGAQAKIYHKPQKGTDGLTAQQKLDAMIGLGDVKHQIELIKALAKKNKGKSDFNLHMVFTGNPGTGKTQVARLIANILYDEGVIEVNHCEELDASGLIAEYVGKTAIKTHDAIQKAMGGVLFIDEAYQLNTKSKGDSFGAQAISALVDDLEKYKGKFCVIMAGYEKEMRDMIETNPGFKSRFPDDHFIEFPNYSLADLTLIAKKILADQEYTIEADALDELMKYVASKMFRKNFANAREVRNVLEAVYKHQAFRTKDNIQDRNIILEDVNAFLKKKAPKLESGKTAEQRLDELIGLASVKKELKGIEAVLAKNKNNASKLELNFAFTGNPGTGKTQVANYFADLLYDKGIIPTRNFIKTNRAGLVAGWEGQTALKTHKVFQDALGGVLFVDEAYNLVTGPLDDFGKEALTALLEDMENYRGKLCVVLAGYENEILSLDKYNPGFSSRINHWIEFPDYNLDEIKEILKKIASDDGYTLNNDALEEASKIIELDRGSKNFANARSARNIFKALMQIQALRTQDNNNSADDTAITLEDVKTYEKDHNISFEKKIKKIDWDISYGQIKTLSKQWNDSMFVYKNSFVEECSVNIKIIKNGEEAGEGSGFLISPKGYIATNHHVAGDADEMVAVVNIKTSNGQNIKREYAAELVASSKEHDVAIIGILNPDIEFKYYRLAEDNGKYPELLTTVIMGGYPMGADRFANVTLLEGKVQSINKDAYSGEDMDLIFIDMLGQPGSSGSGIIDKATGRAIAVFQGVSIHRSDPSLKIRRSIPIKYLWELLKSLKSSENEPIDDFEEEPVDNFHQDRDDFYNEDRNRRDLDEYDRDINPYEHIHLVIDNIVNFEGDALVNTANEGLNAGDGVCGDVFDAAGYFEMKEACKKIGHCETGHSVVTPGFNLKVKYVIHTVGPRYENPEARSKLRMAYETLFIEAMNHRCRTVALPSISTGHFHYLPEEAVPIALNMISIYAGRQVKEVYIYLKDGKTAELYKEELEKRKNGRN